MNLSFVKNVKPERLPKAFLTAWFEEVYKNLKKEDCLRGKPLLKTSELTLVFVSRSQIKKLNSQYRGQNKATDVLSFDGDGFVSFGELIFCLEVIRAKAKKHGLPLQCYLSMLLTHGLLHLLGYEHEKGGADEQEMFALQNKIMRKVAAKLAPKYKTSFDVD